MHGINNYINNGIKEPIRQYQNCKIGHLFLLGGFVYVRQFCVLELLVKPMPFLHCFDVGVFLFFLPLPICQYPNCKTDHYSCLADLSM